MVGQQGRGNYGPRKIAVHAHWFSIFIFTYVEQTPNECISRDGSATSELRSRTVYHIFQLVNCQKWGTIMVIIISLNLIHNSTFSEKESRYLSITGMINQKHTVMNGIKHWLDTPFDLKNKIIFGQYFFRVPFHISLLILSQYVTFIPTEIMFSDNFRGNRS